MSGILDKARGAAAFERKEECLPTEASANGGYFVSQYAPKQTAWRDRIRELQAIRLYKDDWDGEGSVAPGPEVTDGAIAFAQNRARCGHAPPDCVTAGVNGTICFEWRTSDGYCEVEIYSPSNAEQRFVPTGTNDVNVERFPTGECGPGYEF